MGFEIDFLPVGNASHGGDAIALRYGNLYGSRDEQTVIVIDGGYSTEGEALVEHINRYYDTDHVDIVISTHPDQDHISGLTTVLNNLTVDVLLMHVPERHDRALGHASTFETKTALVGEVVAKSLTQAEGLYALALRKHVDVVEPFSGTVTTDHCFRILGPTRHYYEALLAEMQGGDKLPGSLSHFDLSHKASRGPIGTASEDFETETLTDTSQVSASNNSSVISMLEVDGKRLLFTADAGEEALRPVVDQLHREGIAPGDFHLVQVPHHGSRKNVTPALLDDLLGDFTPFSRGRAYLSAPKANPDHVHPAKQTINAFSRRGFPVKGTQGRCIRYHHNAPSRGWSTGGDPLPLYQTVERFHD